MPCYSGPEEYAQRDQAQRMKLEAVLCGVFRFVESRGSVGEFLDSVDWGQVGASKGWALQWWENHKEEDALRERAIESREKLELKRLKEKYGE